MRCVLLAHQLLTHLDDDDAVHRLYDTYVIDIAILDAESSVSGQARAVVIELNPFAPSTGPSLFDWEVDSKQLKAGQTVELRLRQTEVPNVRQPCTLSRPHSCVCVCLVERVV
jgi:hypothetical protein